ncbi:uncharacterized protein NEPG_01507 [Nematocida parisii ERTm1]|uniref:uncharacterized protein n=1 Tax=Nematocida parisii (strain ERTm1 / ATCC PRA-289) TaxID=881290 RepID=UPI000264B6F0|nr:uncharacterized protein NEPG_01507 [Nematocida parisii ERTm1]EIJ93935.1 hypothetical protein NEPG_01507 [Nematocida parisii ERTm1]|eukprot:XP_013059335.1 hypothetical protein NEPG_01507 [Nematocida parisii ERTm1]
MIYSYTKLIKQIQLQTYLVIKHSNMLFLLYFVTARNTLNIITLMHNITVFLNKPSEPLSMRTLFCVQINLCHDINIMTLFSFKNGCAWIEYFSFE